MKKLAKFSKEQKMTSLEISELVNSRHDKVKQSIERLSKGGYISLPPLGEVKKNQSLSSNNKSIVYVFEGERGRLDSIVVVAQLSPAFTAALVKRWDELEKGVELEKERLQYRSKAALQAPELTDAIKLAKEEAGKKVMPYHFSTEFDMINRIVLGKTAKQYKAYHEFEQDAAIRDTLSANEIKAIEYLQRSNTALIDAGIDYDNRKEMLTKTFKKKFEAALIGEILRLEA